MGMGVCFPHIVLPETLVNPERVKKTPTHTHVKVKASKCDFFIAYLHLYSFRSCYLFIKNNLFVFSYHTFLALL